LQRVHLGVRFSRGAVPAFADDRAIAHQHAAHSRIGVGGRHAQPRKLQGAGHVAMICG
jgi:hypothetical protein